MPTDSVAHPRSTGKTPIDHGESSALLRIDVFFVGDFLALPIVAPAVFLHGATSRHPQWST